MRLACVMVITPLIGHRSTARPHGYFNGAGGRSAYLKDAGSASEVIQMKRHGVISTGAQTPDSPVAPSWRLRRLHFPTTPATAPKRNSQDRDKRRGETALNERSVDCHKTFLSPSEAYRATPTAGSIGLSHGRRAMTRHVSAYPFSSSSRSALISSRCMVVAQRRRAPGPRGYFASPRGAC
jgi:hypothetical protein